ncbi:MAG: hypothetical protein V3U30_02360 [Thermoplasmata archaeon]
MAVMEERRHDRRLAALEDYLRREYGSTSGMERYIEEANHAPSPRSGLRAFLAKITGIVVRPGTHGTTPAASVELGLSKDRAEHTAPAPRVPPVPRARSVSFRGRLNVRPRTPLPPPER